MRNELQERVVVQPRKDNAFGWLRKRKDKRWNDSLRGSPLDISFLRREVTRKCLRVGAKRPREKETETGTERGVDYFGSNKNEERGIIFERRGGNRIEFVCLG